MSNSMETRRRFLASTAGVTLALGLAGCVSQGGSGSEPSPDEATPTEQHEDGGDDHDDGHDDDGGHTDEDDDGHDHDEGTPEEPSPTAQVRMRTEGSQQHYDPHIVWVETGGTVTWETESGQHNAVAYHPENDDGPLRIPEEAAPWSTEMLGEGQAASHTFETEGVYDYYCTPHEGVGMVGTVIVGEPDAHDQLALEEPQPSLPDGARSELSDLGEKVNEALGHTH